MYSSIQDLIEQATGRQLPSRIVLENEMALTGKTEEQVYGSWNATMTSWYPVRRKH